MIAPHRINGRQLTKALPSSAYRVTEDSERRTIEHEGENAPRHTESSHLNWEMLAIWSLVVFSFAALFFCLWTISSKCHSDWPL
jgi:hypothetical protein